MPKTKAPKAAGSTEHNAVADRIQRSFWVADRGPRPVTRGWGHLIAAILSVISSTVLITYSWMTLGWVEALGVTIYGIGLVGLFAVSALYHRWPWPTARAVQWWRRADHATISVFIAATYTPLCIIAFDTRTAAWMLGIAWTGALCAVILNLVWINHPRWLDVVVYLTLGWLVVPLIPTLWSALGPAVVWLLAAGGVFYTVGAVVYGLKWPGRNAKYYGYHEHFHTATIAAAVVHLVAVWMAVVQAG